MAARKDMSGAYFDALDLPKTAITGGISERQVKKEVDGSRKLALDRAHELRKFEIENYWKRATYFWSFQVIAFAVLGLFFKDGKPPENFAIIQIPAALGAVSALVAYLSAKGSKFWQENWEAHVDMLEEATEGRLTQTIWSDGKRSNSVSRLNQEFMRLLMLGWSMLMVAASFPELRTMLEGLPPSFRMIALLVTMVWLYCSTLQKLSGYHLESMSWIKSGESWKWNWKRRGQTKDDRRLQLRDTKAFDAAYPKETE